MMTNVHLLAVIPLFSFASSRLPEPSESEYAFTQISAPFDGSDQTLAYGINDLGWIVGVYHDPGGDHGYLLKQGQFTPINVPFPGAIDTEAFGINLQGHIVGSYQTSDGSLHAFLLSRDRYTAIDAPTPGETFARGINIQGEIVGGYRDVSGDHGFLWRQGVFTPIDVPFAGAHDTTTLGINSLGQIVGGYTGDDDLLHGFVLQQGHFAPLDEPRVTETLPYGINNREQIVGTINFIFEHGHFKQLSGTPETPAPNDVNPLAINDLGVVLVSAKTAAGDAAFLGVPIRRRF